MFKKRTTGNLLAMSAVIVCVCFAMLLGTTFAWFTDTAKTQVNTIQSGKFDVQLIGFDATGAEKDLTVAPNDTIKFVLPDGSEYDEANTYWEPGVTFYTEGFVIRNAGNYAFEYKIDLFSNAIVTKNAEGKSLLDVIVFTIGYYDANGNFVDSGLIAGNASVGELVLLPGTDSEKFIITAHMAEEAGNDYQELAISDIALTVTATQTPYETDSYGKDYDKDAEWPKITIDALSEALAAGGETVLGGDVVADKSITMTNGGTFDGNGNTITGKTSVSEGVNSILSTTGGAVTNVNVIADPAVASVKTPRALYMPSFTEDLYISNSHFEAVYAMNINTANANYGVYANNCTFVGWVSYSTIKEARFADCDFDGTYDSPYIAPVGYSMARVRPYADTEFIGCTFKGDVVVDAGAAGLTITFEDCYVDDASGNIVALTASNIKTLLATEADHGLDACTVIVDGVTVTW